MINESRLNYSNSIFVNYFKIHFDHFKLEQSDIDILFAISENTLLNHENLLAFNNTIKESIEIFQNVIEQDEDFNIITDIFNEIILLTTSVDGSESQLRNDLFINSNILLSKKMNYQKGILEYSLKINELEVSDSKIYLYNSFTNQFDEIIYADLEIKAKKDFIFSYITADKVYLFIPEDELSTCYRRISERYSIYNEAKKLNDYNTLELFPVNNYYTQALNSFNQSDKTSIISKLKNHYFASPTNIASKIVNWLSIFNKDSISGSQLELYMNQNGLDLEFLHKSILYIINSHEYISDIDITNFEHKLNEFKSNTDYHLLPLKNPQDDTNGLYRLINSYDKGGRLYNFKDNIFGKFFVAKKFLKNDIIVIVNDIFLTGSQTKKALEY